jgi:hypothetical protein
MEGIFLAFLFGTGKNCATFGLGGSECDVVSKDDPSINFRKPSLMSREACNTMLEGLDRGLPPITSWQQLYVWLGRGNGWAYFTADSAKQLLPHWFVETEYKCQQEMANGYRSGPFIDLDAFRNGKPQLSSETEMIGPDAENYGETKRRLDQFEDNFIITRKSIFVV